MTKHYDLNRGSTFIEPVPDALMEYLGAASPSFRLSLADAVTLQVVAGVDNAQVAIAINGRWRYNSTTVSAPPPSGAATYDIYVTGSDNVITPGGALVATVDTTVYSFGLVVRTTVPATALYRKVGEADWDGAKYTAVRHLLPGNYDTDTIQPTAQLTTQTPVKVRGIASQTAPLVTIENVSGVSQVSLGLTGIAMVSGTTITWNGDTTLQRSGANALQTLGAFSAGGQVTATGGVTVPAILGQPVYRAAQIAADPVIRNYLLTADASPAFQVGGDGKLSWGAGGASAVDTVFYRLSAGVLKTDTALSVNGGLTASSGISSGGNITLPSASTVTWNADTTLSRAGANSLQTLGAFTAAGMLTSTGGITSPAIGGGVPGHAFNQTSSNLVLWNKLLAADAQPAFVIQGNGAMSWGPGGAAGQDVSLGRSTASTLLLSGQLSVINNLNAASTLSVGAGATFAATVGITGKLTLSGSGVDSPVAATQTVGDSSTRLATTAFVTAAVAGVTGGTGGIAYLGNVQSFTAVNTFQDTVNLTKATGTGLAVTSNTTIGGTLGVTGFATLTAGAKAGAQAGQSLGVWLTVRNPGNGNSIEFGHSNTAGYANTLGNNTNDGAGFLAFNGEAGTNAGTFRTRGVGATLLRSDLAGGLYVDNVANPSADNQAPVNRFHFDAGGNYTGTGDVVSWSGGANQTRIGNTGSLPSIAFGTSFDTWIQRTSALNLATNGSFAIGSTLTVSGTTLHSGATSVAVGTTADTSTYAPFGITRPATASNLAYAAFTKAGTLVWGIGINSPGDMIFGIASAGQIISAPVLRLGSGIGFNGTAPFAKPTGYGAGTQVVAGTKGALSSGSNLNDVITNLSSLIADLRSYGLIGA